MASGESAGEAMDASFVVDIGLDMEKLHFSQSPRMGSFQNMVQDESSINMVEVNPSDADLHQALDSIIMTEHLEVSDDTAAVFIKTDNSEDSQLNKLMIQYDEPKNSMQWNPSSSVNIKHPFSEGKTLLSVDTDQICEQLCCSSRYMSGENSEQKNESIKPSKSRRKPPNFSEVDFTSLKVLRKSRSSSAKPARSSIWGSQIQILPDFVGRIESNQNFGPDKKLTRGRGGKEKGKKNTNGNRLGKNSTGRTGQKSSGKNNFPMRHISLKVRIGNKSCSIANVGEAPYLVGNVRRVGEKLSGDDVSVPPRDEEKVMPSVNGNSACGKQVDVRSDFLSLNGERDFHQITCLEALDNLRTNQFSDVGTSPDSEVINAVPDASQSEKGLRSIEGSSRALNVSVSPPGVSKFTSSKKTSKKGKKDRTLHHVEDHTLDKLTVADATNDSIEKGKLTPELTVAREGNKSTSGRKNKKPSKRKGGHSTTVANRVSETICASSSHTRTDCHPKAEGQTPLELGESRGETDDFSGPINDCRLSSVLLKDQYKSLRNAWVLCDDCEKWRRIPASLADQIAQTDCGWTCKANMDKDFADCSVPQEKSNSEINEELELSDGSYEEDGRHNILSNHKESKVADQPSWFSIKSNMFLHRRRKTQTIDEVMVCHCKPPSDGRMGCGTKCLNRMLNIECVRGTCPCGDLCSNQQFQKRTYAKLKWIRCGKKGFGLQAFEDISEGRFLIEYVGEVLDMRAYEARQKEYAMQGHRHFYFMTLNGSEVIDACAKGNLGRFINHSCEPNCRTEKWMVNGEVCVGLFSLRNIKKGEEVTFDYNYVRVFGAAAKKCVCGSSKCRGFIGGDPTNTELIVQDDSDEEYREPVLIGDEKNDEEDIVFNSSKIEDQEIVKPQSVKKYRTKKCRIAAAKGVADQPSIVKIDTVVSADIAVNFDGGRLKGSVANDGAAEAEELDRNRNSEDSIDQSDFKESQDLDMQSRASSQTIDLPSEDGLSPYECAREQASPCKEPPSEELESKQGVEHSPHGVRGEPESSNLPAKTKCPSLAAKRRLSKRKVGNEKGIPEVNKNIVQVDKSKNMVELSLTGHFEAVEQKLNELLDPEGGISKRKDASKGYLKLLFLTAASENNGDGEAIQSNRDLSMILDALLKTKSRSVLVDIINKNGMQMLHNIMKRYRKEFIKTPILRKLLKVLEYLAVRDILTLEHITGGPPCPGVESFKDSILTLTEHADKKVHQIARSFRDRWIPKHLRRHCHIDWDEGRTLRPIHGAVLGSPHCSGGKSSGGDLQHVAASGTIPTSVTVGLYSSANNCATDGTRIRKRKSRWDCPAEEYSNSRPKVSSVGDEGIDDIPPGFSSCVGPPVSVASAISVQEREMKNDNTPPGFSSHCNVPGIHSCSVTTSAMEKGVMPDSPTEKDLAEEDMPPGFSSPCNVPGVPSGPSYASLGLQVREECRNTYARDSNLLQHPHSSASWKRLKMSDEAPPGFSPPCSGPRHVSGAASTATNHQEKEMHKEQNRCGAFYGEPQLQFSARIPLAYGVPSSAVRLFGVQKAEDWIKAPGLPFRPFPPLPPSSSAVAVAEDCAGNYRVKCSTEAPKKYAFQDFEQVQSSSANLGRKFFRQQKGSQPKLPPPWVRMRNGWSNSCSTVGK